MKRGPAWLVHCNNNPVAEAKLFMSPRKLNGHDFFLYQRVSQKNVSDERLRQSSTEKQCSVFYSVCSHYNGHVLLKMKPS